MKNVNNSIRDIADHAIKLIKYIVEPWVLGPTQSIPPTIVISKKNNSKHLFESEEPFMNKEIKPEININPMIQTYSINIIFLQYKSPARIRTGLLL